MQPSVFTKIVNGEIPAAKVYEDEHTIAFMDAGQVNPGHVIVATRRQLETILDLDDDLAAALFRTAARVARAVDRAFKPEGITILQANKPAGWQTVPHGSFARAAEAPGRRRRARLAAQGAAAGAAARAGGAHRGGERLRFLAFRLGKTMSVTPP